MTREQLAQGIMDVAYLEGEFLLRSGKISNFYFDKYQFEADPNLLNAISDFMIELLPDEFDLLGALEMGGIPLAALISVKINKPVVFIRKKAKEYGTKKLAEGPDVNGKKVVMIEDIVTSGGQIILSTHELRKEGAIIEHAICVIDRETLGEQALAAAGVQLKSVYKSSGMPGR